MNVLTRQRVNVPTHSLERSNVSTCQRIRYPQRKGKAAQKESAAQYRFANPKDLWVLSITAALADSQDKHCGVPRTYEPRRNCDGESNDESEEKQLETSRTDLLSYDPQLLRR